jgi:hypothetical protein
MPVVTEGIARNHSASARQLACNTGPTDVDARRTVIRESCLRVKSLPTATLAGTLELVQIAD